ncbi:serine hydrolase domain-containing protein [Humibacillus xanthopallidus]|uniref:D-alanyl-D-alanine carboxypeptidase n=1 Tax=Humibacillus xanthopallidus TaxID=412689 RepID=A0A543I353_9MICO|nr:serine hydrolase domain-containing protein [Humibacillus xanthopallidus]TQM65024.1 D-alanyl-D-alanine carboxypeptidase [Humibacillus xanthopallidus]
MRRPSRVPVIAVPLVAATMSLAGCGGGVTPATQPAPTGSGPASTSAAPDYASTLQTQIPEIMKENAIPGAVVLIESPGKGSWSATFGTAQLGATVPMSLDDHLRIGSNAKTMTSTVILQLVEEGSISLDDPISDFRPDVPNGENITIAQLSEMRSGLYSYTFDPGFNKTLDDDPQKAWTPDELLAIALRHPANFEPGTQFEYSNTNTVLLGAVIEKVTGMSASEAFEKRIFEPLGLKNTSLPAADDASIPTPHARGYQFGTNVDTIDSYAVPSDRLPQVSDGTLLPIDQTEASPSWAWTAGGAISTPRDLAVYAKALVTGGLLKPETQKLRIDSIKPTVAGQPSGVGYGLGIAQFAPGVLGHDGQLPGYSSFMVHNLATDDTIIIGVNLSASPIKGENAAVVVAKAVIATLYGSSATPAETTSSTPTPTST